MSGSGRSAREGSRIGSRFSLNRKMSGKIIAIVGAPRSGKSFLAKKLAAHYRAALFLEGESEEGGREFPAWLQESIAENKWRLARQLWFRSRLVRSHLAAQKLQRAGRVAVLDACWLSSQFYVETTLDSFERDLMRELGALDREWLSLPDLIILLKISEVGIRRFLERGGRSFDRSESYLTETILPVNRLHVEFFDRNETDSELNVLSVERDNLDFANENDFRSLIKRIEEKLN